MDFMPVDFIAYELHGNVIYNGNIINFWGNSAMGGIMWGLSCSKGGWRIERDCVVINVWAIIGLWIEVVEANYLWTKVQKFNKTLMSGPVKRNINGPHVECSGLFLISDILIFRTRTVTVLPLNNSLSQKLL